MKRILVTLLTILLTASSAFADVVITVSKDYYEVDGTDIPTIVTNLKQKSPLKGTGRTYTAETRTKIEYKYRIERKGNICRVQRMTIYLHLTYFYPKLKHSVDYKTRNWWKTMFGKLENHELIHGDISTRNVHEIDAALRGLQARDCNELKAKVKAISQQHVDKMRKQQVAYDKLTDHGLRQELYTGPQPRYQ